MIYLLIAFGALWGILTLVSLRQEQQDIQEMLDSARKATYQRAYYDKSTKLRQ